MYSFKPRRGEGKICSRQNKQGTSIPGRIGANAEVGRQERTWSLGEMEAGVAEV